MPTYAQSNPPEVDSEYGDHESHGAHGGTCPMMVALVDAQPTHPEIIILGHGGLHHAHHQ
jgi:hypothetical protein